VFFSKALQRNGDPRGLIEATTLEKGSAGQLGPSPQGQSRDSSGKFHWHDDRGFEPDEGAKGGERDEHALKQEKQDVIQIQ
jgi:hypothetical protein